MVPLHTPLGLMVLQLPLSYLSFLQGNSASWSRTSYSPGIGGGFPPTSFILLLLLLLSHLSHVRLCATP